MLYSIEIKLIGGSSEEKTKNNSTSFRKRSYISEDVKSSENEF